MLSSLLRVGFVCFFAALSLWGQLTRGFLSGTVEDATGAVIGDATVKLTNKATGLTQESVSNNFGFYRFVAVEPGTYSVEFSKQGFEARRVENIVVRTSQEVTLNQQLQVGQTTTAVEVTEGAAGVELQKSSATVERTLNQKLVQELPVFAQGAAQLRDVTQLALLAPNVTRGPGATGVSASGQRARNNNFLVDGVDNNDLSVTLPTARIIPEAVAEFQTQTTAYSAEFGRNTGAQIAVITRSGSNEFHGDAFWYHRGNWMEPVSLLNKRAGINSTPRFTQNEAGGALGGPVIKNRTFFFGLVDTLRRREAPDARNATAVVIPRPEAFALFPNIPLGEGQTAESRQASLNSLNFLRDFYPGITRFDSPQNVNVNGVAIPVGTIRVPLANPFTLWNYQARADHRLSDKDSLTYRLLLDKENRPDFTSNVGFGSLFAAAQVNTSQNHAGSYTRTFTPTLINEFRYGFTRRNLDFPENDPDSPTVAISNAFTIGGLSNFPQGRKQNTHQFQNVATWIAGRHSVKFGADIRYNMLLNVADFDSKGTWTFNNLADFINNRAVTFVQAVTTASFDARQTNQFYFVQDDFRVTRDLTVNLGVRYEYSDVPFGLFGTTDPQRQAALIPGPVQADKNNWAPRVGFAYSPSKGGWLFGDGRTVFRGGYGIAYDVLFYNILTVNTNPLVVRDFNDNTAALANLYPRQPGRTGVVPPFSALNQSVNTPSDAQNPTVHFYSFSIQREMPGRFVAEVGYSGNRSYHGVRQGRGNPAVLTEAQAATAAAGGTIPSLQARRVNPLVGDRVTIETTALGNYNAGYLKVDKRLSYGLTFGASYTFSKSMSDNDESLGVADITNSSPQIPQDWFNYRNEWSRSVFDRPHRAVFFYNYDIPWVTSGTLANGFFRRVFGGWSVSGSTEFQSGQPFTVRTGVDTYGNNSTAGRPDWNPSGQWTFDPVTGDLRTFTAPLGPNSVFQTPLVNGAPAINRQARFGNLGRNTFRGPGLQLWGVSFAKTIPVTERVRILLRSDWSNFFNHRNFGNPVSAMNSPAFGTNTTNPGGRTGFLVAKIQF